MKNYETMKASVFENIDENADISELIGELAKEINTLEYTLSDEEQTIIEKIKKVLTDQKKEFEYSEDNPREFFYNEYEPGNLTVMVRVDFDNTLELRVTYPFLALAESLPILALKANELNLTSDLLTIINMETGQIHLVCKLINNQGSFDEDVFKSSLDYLYSMAKKRYTLFHKLSAGRISSIYKEYYKSLLETSLNALNGNDSLLEENEEAQYGASKIKYLNSWIYKAKEYIDKADKQTLEFNDDISDFIGEEVPTPIGAYQ